MATTAEIQKMPSIVTKNTRYFYEIDKQGNKVLRHILVGSLRNILNVPSDGQITIDTLPPDSVGTEQIENGSVNMEDLNQQIFATPAEARSIVAAAIAKPQNE